MMNHQGLLIRASPTVWHIGLASFNFYKNDKNTSPTVRHTAWQILATRKKQPLDAHICALSPTWHRRFRGKKSSHDDGADGPARRPPCTRSCSTNLRRHRPPALHDDRSASQTCAATALGAPTRPPASCSICRRRHARARGATRAYCLEEQG